MAQDIDTKKYKAEVAQILEEQKTRSSGLQCYRRLLHKGCSGLAAPKS